MALYLAVAPVLAQGEPVAVPPDGDALPTEPGSRLVAVVNNGSWQSAMDVTYPDTYRRLRQRIEEGVWQDCQLYRLEENAALALADGRRARMDGQPVPDPGRALRR